jgi:hypothetical protein
MSMRGDSTSTGSIGRRCFVRLVKRMTVALGSLLAVALAGGAHWRF